VNPADQYYLSGPETEEERYASTSTCSPTEEEEELTRRELRKLEMEQRKEAGIKTIYEESDGEIEEAGLFDMPEKVERGYDADAAYELEALKGLRRRYAELKPRYSIDKLVAMANNFS